MSPLLTEVLLLVLGIAVLYFGAEWLVRGSARLAASLGVLPIVVGLTVVSMGTSAPELVVCLVAALRGNSDLAMGNVMGSNLANIGLILGLTAIIRPLEVTGRVINREIPIMIAVTLLIFPLALDQQLGRPDGVLLIVVLGLYLLFVNRAAGEETPKVKGEYEAFVEVATKVEKKVHLREVALVVAGSGALVLGGMAIVGSAEFLASAFGVPDIIVGLTVVAVGTSLPELATSLVAAMRREADIAVGNVIGSNIFNLAAILGTTSIVTPVTVDRSVLTEELPAVLVISLLAFPVTRSAHRIRRWEGAILLCAYVALGVWLVAF
jgi:cation:H+ antiporter